MSDTLNSDSLEIEPNDKARCSTHLDSRHIQFDERQRFVYHLFDPKKRNRSQQSALFLWHQMLKTILQAFPSDPLLQEDISAQTKLIHDVLCTEEIEVIYLYRSTILHFCSTIENEVKSIPTNEIVYYTQTMSEEEIVDIQEHTGGFLSIDGFFLASRNIVQEHSSVLFEIHIDLTNERLDAQVENNDILFNLNYVFQITSVEYHGEEHFWKIKLIVDDQTSKCVLQSLENERNSQNPLLFFGHLLWYDLSRINQAKNFFQMLLKFFPHIIPNTHHELGNLHEHIGDYSSAVNNYQQALDILQEQIPPNETLIAILFNEMGRVYQKKADVTQALNFYQQALAIQERVYLDDHSSKSNTLRDIGLVYRDQEDWCHALDYLKRAFEMRQRLFSTTSHPDLTISYRDLGHIYEKLNQFDLALDCYHQLFRLDEQSRPINSSNLIIHFHWMINILKKKEQIEHEIELFEEKVVVLKNLLENDYEHHPQLARLLLSIATIYEDRNPKGADRHYQRALEILEQHRTDATFPSCLSAMTNFYWKCRMFDRALIYQLKLLNLRRSILSSNDIDIAYAHRGSARLYRVMNKSYEALFHFEQSLVILQTSCGADHVDVKNIQKEIVDLQETIKSVSSSAKEDYDHRRSSNAHKELLISSPEEPKSEALIPTTTDQKSVSKSSTCIIL